MSNRLRRPSAKKSHAPLTQLTVETLEDRAVPDATYHNLAASDFSQDWSNTGSLLTTNDDWSKVASIVGYLGDDTGAGSGGSTNPWDVTADSTTVDLVANSTATAGAGGVHEIEASPQAIALQGSGSARSPYIAIYLDATGRQNLEISYVLKELDNDNANQKFALQYRVGTSGAWTDIAAGHVSDTFNATGMQTSPQSNISLPAAGNNQAQVQIRIITTDASGPDAMVGIDDIVITSEALPNDPPVVTPSGGTTSYAENDAATAIDSGITVTDSNDANLAKATVQITSGYVNGQDILAFEDTATITGSFDASTGTLTLSGSDTVGHYQDALQAVTYLNTSDAPDTTDRVIAFVANDGTADSSAKTKTVTVTAVNDAPTLKGSNNFTAIDEDDAGSNGDLVSDLISGNVSDPDGSGSGIAITAIDEASGTWQYTTDGGGNWSDVGSVDDAHSLLLAADFGTRIRFVPNQDFNGTVTGGLTFRAWDQTGGSPEDRADASATGGTSAFSGDTASPGITVNAVNDAPAGADATLTTLQDTHYTFTAEDFGFSDKSDNSANNFFAVKITTLPAAGTLKNGTNAVNAGDFVSVDDINFGKLTFTPAPDADGTGYASFTFQVQDDGGTDKGGVDLDQSPNTITVNVTAVNDAPSFTASNPAVVDENSGAHTVPGFITGFSPGGGSDESAQSALGYTVSTVSNPGLFAVAPSVDASGTLTYTLKADAFGTSTFDVTVQDDGGTDNNGVDTSAAQTFTIKVNPSTPPIYINEILYSSPGFSAPNQYLEFRGPANFTIPNGTYLVAIDGAIRTDPISGNLLPNRGDVFQIFDLSGFTFGSNGFLVLLQRGNTYTTDPAATTITPVGTGPFGFEGLPGFSADAGGPVRTSNSFLLIRSAVAPTLTDDIDSDDDGTADGSVYSAWTTLDSVAFLPGGTALNRSYAAITFENGGLGTASGTVVSTTFAAGYVGRYGDSTGSSATDWVAARLTIGAPNPYFTLDSLHTPPQVYPVSLAGAPLDHIGSTNFINSTPVNSVPSAQTVNEDTALVFSSGNKNAITVADSDAGANALKVKLTVTSGTLTLGGTTGLTITGGANGTASVEFTGTVAAINTALDGLTFNPAPDSDGSVTLQVLTDDQGNSGTGGSKTDSDSVAITVNAVNDAPSGTDKTVTTLEDTDYTFTTADFDFADPNDAPANNLLTVKVTTLPGAGVLTDNGIAVTAGQFISLADIATGKLKFTPAHDANGTGYASFTFQVQDDGGTDSGGIDLDQSPNTITVNVTAVNDKPSVALAKNSITVNQDSGTFTQSAFASFSPGGGPDEATQTPTYTVTNTNNALFNGVLGQPATDANGKLTFTPASGASGTADVFVTVTDSGAGTPPNDNTSTTMKFTVSVTPTPVVVVTPPTAPKPVSVAASAPASPGPHYIAIGSDAGTPSRVQILDAASGQVLADFSPFGSYSGGVRAAVGDINGDGTDDIILATAGTVGMVEAIDGRTGATIGPITPFGNAPTGLEIALGDIDGDGRLDLLVGMQTGGTSVMAFTSRSGVIGPVSLFPGTTGVRMALGDVNGDGRTDLVFGSGPGGNGQIFVFDGATGNLLGAFPSHPGFPGEVNLAVGDIDGDGKAEILTAIAAQFGTEIDAYTPQGHLVRTINTPTAIGATTGFARDTPVTTTNQSARVATADLTGDHIADILIGSTTGNGASRFVVLNGANGDILMGEGAFDPLSQFGLSMISVG